MFETMDDIVDFFMVNIIICYFLFLCFEGIISNGGLSLVSINVVYVESSYSIKQVNFSVWTINSQF